MSEPMPAQIWIGSRLPAAMVACLCAAICRQGLSTDWGDGPFRPETAEDLLDACKPQQSGATLLWLCDDQAHWGQFPSLERFLEEHEIPYSRLSSGRDEYDPQRVEFRPTIGRVELDTNSGGQPVVLASRLAEVRSDLGQAINAIRTGVPETAVRILETCRQLLSRTLPPQIPPLEPFEIAGRFGRTCLPRLDPQSVPHPTRTS